MNHCPKCGETNEAQFDSCWKCGTEFSAPTPPDVVEDPRGAGMPRKRAVARYRHFRGTFTSWDSLLSQAAEFASSIGRERLITISHSEDENDGVVVVWYWANAEEKEMP